MPHKDKPFSYAMLGHVFFIEAVPAWNPLYGPER